MEFMLRCGAAAESTTHFIPGDSRCTVLGSSDGQWLESRDNVTWSVVPCCFKQQSVTAVVCSARMPTTSNCARSLLCGRPHYGSCPSVCMCPFVTYELRKQKGVDKPKLLGTFPSEGVTCVLISSSKGQRLSDAKPPKMAHISGTCSSTAGGSRAARPGGSRASAA